MTENLQTNEPGQHLNPSSLFFIVKSSSKRHAQSLLLNNGSILTHARLQIDTFESVSPFNPLNPRHLLSSLSSTVLSPCPPSVFNAPPGSHRRSSIWKGTDIYMEMGSTSIRGRSVGQLESRRRLSCYLPHTQLQQETHTHAHTHVLLKCCVLSVSDLHHTQKHRLSHSHRRIL